MGEALPKSERLMELLRLLRRRRRAVKGEDLARTLGVSLRTLYRDVAALQARGVPVDGAAGVGFVLRPGYEVPQIMFTTDELEALVLGARWVSARGGASLGAAARRALEKVEAVLPPALRTGFEENALLVPPAQPRFDDRFLEAARTAIREDRRMAIEYRDGDGADSRRTICPIALGFLESAWILAAWCELRGDFRHFRADRVLSWSIAGPSTLPRRELLLRWSEVRGYDLEAAGFRDC